MNKKFWITPIAIVVMLSASAATVFASGEKDDKDSDEYGPWNGRGDGREYGRMMDDPRGNRRDGRAERPELETSSYEGRLSLEEGRLPELVTDDGDIYSLVVHFPIAAEDLPENGAAISVEAVEAPMTRWDWSGSDKYLMVVSAEVNGVELKPAFSEDGFYGGMFGGARHGFAMHGGPGFGGPMRGGRGNFGNPWDYNDGEATE